jgi:predicted DNA-binding antitoxin AbrB/MazE fold protein
LFNEVVMTKIVTAIYENGVLRPLKPLPLQERQTVYLQILSNAVPNETQQLLQGLVEAGLLTPPQKQANVAPVPDEERRRLAERLGKAAVKPLSEMIFEERGEW